MPRLPRVPRSLLPFVALAFALAAIGCQESSPGRAPEPDAPPVVALEPRDDATTNKADQKALPLASIATRAKGEDWPGFLGPRRDSTSIEQGVLTNWNDSPPRIVWRFPLHEGYAIGTVAAGRYFQCDAERGVATLYCLNAETGAEIWKFAYDFDYRDMYGYDSGPRCSPIVDEGRVYLYGVEGTLHCVEAATGDLLWKVDVNADYGVVQNFFGVGSNPVVHGDLLLVMVGGSAKASASLDQVEPNGTAVVAFDKRTGKEVYRVGDDLASYASMQWAAIGKRDYGLAFCRRGLLAFDPATGKEDFHFPWRARILESVNAAMPVVVRDEVLITETYGPGSALLAIDGSDATPVWEDDPTEREKALQCHWNTPVVVDGYVYGSSGRHTEDAELRCVEWKTGKVAWSEPGLTRSSLLFVDGHFICLTEMGELVLFKANPEKFDLVARWTPTETSDDFLARERQSLRYPAWAAPILSHGLLYVRGADQLLCVELIPE